MTFIVDVAEASNQSYAKLGARVMPRSKMFTLNGEPDPHWRIDTSSESYNRKLEHTSRDGLVVGKMKGSLEEDDANRANMEYVNWPLKTETRKEYGAKHFTKKKEKKLLKKAIMKKPHH
ncbi:hypothetical protein L7F22_022155 [Adiantum nelumboides]|nr:hypothetical protein [Adiantum nelumboides]